MRTKESIVLHQLLMVLLMFPLAQLPGIDLLDTGIVFSGPVKFNRGGNNTTNFTVSDHSSLVLLRMDTQRAFSLTSNTSMSYQWAQMLARARGVSVRMADIRDMPPGTAIRGDLLDMVVCVPPIPTERTDANVFYTLRCVAFDEKRQLRTDAGDLIYEIDIVVSVPNHSTADMFLSKPREKTPIYVRLELGQ